MAKAVRQEPGEAVDGGAEGRLVLEERLGRVLLLTLNRPERRNSLNEALAVELTATIERAGRDADVGVVVLRGAGPAFCAGADLDVLQGRTDAGDIRSFIGLLFELFAAVEECSKPVIACIHGHALAGGFELCLAADLVVAAEDAVFGAPEVRIGLMPPYACIRLPSVVGLHNAKYLSLVGENINAAEAYRLGIVSVVSETAALDATALELARRIADNAPLGLAAGKALLNRSARDGYEHCVEAVTMLQLTEDVAEGIAAFREGRSPGFHGR